MPPADLDAVAALIEPEASEEQRDLVLGTRISGLMDERNATLKPFSIAIGIGSLSDCCRSIPSVVFPQPYNHLSEAEDATIRECARAQDRREHRRRRRQRPLPHQQPPAQNSPEPTQGDAEK